MFIIKVSDYMINFYEVTLDSDVFAISLVDRPAIEENFIYLSEHQPTEIFLEENDKHLIIGAVLVPDKPIYRNQGGEEFYIQFSQETIEHLAHNYLLNGRIYSTTTDHKDIADDIAVVESWLKTSENDKSVSLGMDLPNGTWLAAMKVNNDDVWQRIKAGELRGFSVEAFVDLAQIKLEKHNMNEVKLSIDETSFWTKLRETLASFFNKEEKVEETVEQVELAEETVEEAPIEEEVPVDPIVEEVIDTVETIDETPEEVKEDLQAIVDGLNEKIAEMEGQLAAKDAEIEELKKVNTELSAQPSAKQIKVNASHVEESISFLDYASGRLKLK